MAFAFQPYDNSQSIGQILALMQAGAHAHADAARATGDAQAKAAAISSQNSAQMADTLGHIAMGVSGQIAQQFSPEAKARTADIAAQTAERQAQAEDRQHRNAQAAQEQENRQRLNGLLQESTITDPTTGLVTYDRNTLTKGLTSLGLGDKAPEYLKLLDNSDAAVKTARAAQTDALKQIATVVDATGNDPVVFGNEVKRAIQNGVISERMAAPYLAAVQRDPEHVGRVTGALLGRQPEKLVAHDPTKDLINPQTGAVVVPAKPKEPTKPTSAQEYEYAKTQGYKGSYEQYQNEDANRKKPVTKVTLPGQEPVKMSDEAVDYAAAQVRIAGNGSGVLTRLNDDDRKRILNKVAEQSKALGQSPAQTIQKQAAFKADGSALTQMTKMKSSAESFEAKALAQADKVVELSNKVDRSKWPIVNGALLAGKTEIAGDTDATQLMNAIGSFTAEYAKIIEGSTGSAAGSSDSARRMTERLLSAKMGKGTVADVVKLMKWEMSQTINGYDATISHISDRMGGGQNPNSPKAPPSASAGRVYYDANGNVIK